MIVKDLHIFFDGQVAVFVLVRLGEGLPQLVLPPSVVALLEHQAHGGPVQGHPDNESPFPLSQTSSKTAARKFSEKFSVPAVTLQKKC